MYNKIIKANSKRMLYIGCVSTLVSGSFIGCGNVDNPLLNTPTTVTVERGAVYDAKVTDANGNIAKRTVNSNVYTFSNTPIYPIKAEGGWIDVNADGIMTIGTDVILDIPLTSYSNIITPVTTYIGDIDQDRSKLDRLINDLNTTEIELLKKPSDADYKAIITQNSIYKIMKENSTSDLSSSKFDDINDSYHALELTYYQSYENITVSKDLAKELEIETMNDIESYINRMDSTEKIEFETMESKEKEEVNSNKEDNEDNEDNEGNGSASSSSNSSVPSAFITNVYPILTSKCSSCHSANKGGFTANSNSTTTYNSMSSKGFSYTLSAGNGGNGHGGGDQLNDTQYNTILTWINSI